MRYWQEPNQTNEWNLETRISSASSSEVIIKSGNNASSTTIMLNAPYGVRSEVVSENGQTYATTTPLTQQEIQQMEEQQAASEKQMEQIFQDQQKLLNDMSTNLP